MSSINNLIASLELLYYEIDKIYRSDETEKWHKIATHIITYSDTVNKTFRLVKKNKDRKNIKINYHLPSEDYRKMIPLENNYLTKLSYIVAIIHNIVYDLMSTEGNYYFSLNGPTEMVTLHKNINYYINVSVKVEQNIFFHAFILVIILETLFNRHFYLGIDFEYTYRKIQLAQLNFEHNEVPQNFIMIVNPTELEPVLLKDFVDLIICNKYIRKILHGSDSLDIPYMYDQLLEKNPKKIIKFTRTLIDTRFLCEYYKLNLLNNDNKCAIYDSDSARSAIYYFGVISTEQQENLTRILESMPHVNDIQWNIHKMPQSQVLYAQYDVLFIKWFFYRIIYVAMQDAKTDAEKKDVMILYKHLLIELVQFVYLERHKIYDIMVRCKKEVDPVNNYMIRGSGIVYKLQDVYDKVSKEIVLYNPKIEIDKLINVNYFKSLIVLVIKKMAYTIMNNKYLVYKDKNNVWSERLSNKYIFDDIEKMRYKITKKMFKDVEAILERRIKETII